MGPDLSFTEPLGLFNKKSSFFKKIFPLHLKNRTVPIPFPVLMMTVLGAIIALEELAVCFTYKVLIGKREKVTLHKDYIEAGRYAIAIDE